MGKLSLDYKNPTVQHYIRTNVEICPTNGNKSSFLKIIDCHVAKINRNIAVIPSVSSNLLHKEENFSIVS